MSIRAVVLDIGWVLEVNDDIVYSHEVGLVKPDPRI